MADISIVGAGRVGTSLGRALAARGHHIRALVCRRLASAKESRAIIGQGRPLTDAAKAAARGEILILSLPDDRISAMAARLARAKVDWGRKTVLHTSGFLSAEVLAPLRKMGAAVASFHPAQSFPDKRTPPSSFRGISFGLEGDPKALSLARKLVRSLGGHSLAVSAETKPLYHAACIVASNYAVILWQTAGEWLRRAGIAEPDAVRLIVPLAEGTLRNVKKLDPKAALTGPIVRGDFVTVEAHLKALARFSPRHSRIYREIGLEALETAGKRGLSARKIRTLRKLLEGR
jgi:predicted short-subunit dehydrogenase-like oxidoreductase (DUF2520 family)